MPVILYDRQIFRQQRFGGISRYFSKLMEILSHTAGYKILPATFFSANHHLSPRQTDWYNMLHNTKKFRGRGRLMNYFERKKDREMKKLISEGRFDVFHPTYYTDEFLQYFPAGKPFVITVYDMIHELYYDPFFKTVHEETKKKARLLPMAAHIIAISEHTKKDILSLFPAIDPGKISVIHLGYTQPGNIPAERKIAGDYILFVGGRWLYKNFEWTVKAAAAFLKKHNMQFVCAGGGEFNEAEKQMIRDEGLEAYVQFHDIRDDAVLNAFYRDAFCFIFPSLYEGFGLPVLEGFANNCPVILSNATCFPEIGGDAALYFETGNEESLLRHLENLFHKDLRDSLLKAGRERLKKFSWEKTAEEHKIVYEAVIKNREFKNA